MGTYFFLQCKRIARYLPGAFLAMLVLLGGLLTAFSVMVQRDAQSADNQKFQVGLIGTADDTFVQMGLTALKTFDSTQLSMEIVEMSEPEARDALEKGSIGAYIVIPENFVDEAMQGRILPLKFVSTIGAASVVSVFKEEVTEVISTLLLESQRGVYGMQGAMKDHDIGGRGKKIDALAFTYVEYVLARDRTYSLQELGITDFMGLEDYLLCGLTVLFLLLVCLPFAPVMIRKDLSLSRMLAARGQGAVRQALCDLCAYFAGLLILLLILMGLAAPIFGQQFPHVELLPALPVVGLVAAFSFMLYALSDDLISGVLLQFFLSLALCFVSGCMYPVHFFPVEVQKFAAWLPTGTARSQISQCLTGDESAALPLLLSHTLVFSLIGVAVRVRRVKEARV